MHAHVETGKGIVAARRVSIWLWKLEKPCDIPEQALNNLIGRIRSRLFVGQGVDVCGKTGRGRRIDTGDMVIDTGLGESALGFPCAAFVFIPVSLGSGWHASAGARDQEDQALEDQQAIRFGRQSTRGESPR